MKLIDFLDSLEERLYLFGGMEGYQRDEKRFGNRTLFGAGAFVFWWRELFHCLTGFFVTAPLAFFNPWVGPVFLLGFVSAKEWYFDRNNLGLSFYGVKEVVDILAHVFGAVLISLLVKALF